MQDFRPRLSSTYQPRQSLSNLVTKFEKLDSRPVPMPPKHASPPRRSKTLPAVAPGQWLSSSGDLSEKGSMEEQGSEPEPQMPLPSASTFGKRTKSVAERRKLFEKPGVDATALSNRLSKVRAESKTSLPAPSEARVFSRDITVSNTVPESISDVAHRPVPPAQVYGGEGNATEAVRQVRRMPRLEVARSRTLSSNDHEWPLKSESPLRASFDSSYATTKSFEWKPTPARQRSLSRRRGVAAIQDDSSPREKDSCRSSSGEGGSLEVDESNSTTSPETVNREYIDRHSPQRTCRATQSELDDASASYQRVPPSRDSVGRSRPEAVVASIGFPSSQPTTSPDALSPSPRGQEPKPHNVPFPSRNSGSWAAKPTSSPLRAKIGMFESLSRESSTAESSQYVAGVSQRPCPPPHGVSSFHDPRRTKPAASFGKTAHRVRDTLRRISETWERGQGRRVHPNNRGNAECWANGRRCDDVDKIEEDVEPKKPSISVKKGFDFKENMGRRFFAPFTSFSSNTTAPSGFEKRKPPRENSRYQSIPSDGPKSDCTAILASSGSDKAGSAQSAPATTDMSTHASNHPSWRRRRANRSSGGGTMFARVQCRLEQPVPVRGRGDGELRRLLTFCKDNALRRRSRGQTG